MSRKGMLPLRLSFAMTMLVALGACATAAPPKTASDNFCALYEPTSYALTPRAEREAAAEGRPARDDGNRADSAPTVETADRNNARYDTVCGNPFASPG